MLSSSNMRCAVATAVFLASALSGCSDVYFDRRETVTFAAGDASAAALATQVVNPWPPASADRHIAYNGNIAASAVERYRTCQIIQPRGTTTSGSYMQTAQAAQLGCTPAPVGAASAAPAGPAAPAPAK